MRVSGISSDVARINAAVIGGAITAVTLTVVFVAVPDAIPFEPIRDRLFETTGIWLWDNPFPPLRLLGGIGAGFVAGYLTRGGWDNAVVNAVIAVVAGVAVYFVLAVAFNLATFPGLTSSIAIVLIFQQLFFVALPYTLLYFFEGTVSGVVGRWVAAYLSARVSPDAPQGTQTAIAILVFVSGFAIIWWFGFYFSSVY